MKPLTCKILLALMLFAGLYRAAAQTPTVQFTASPTSGQSPLDVYFSCPSVDSAGNALTNWSWNFGDGTTGTGQNQFHGYSAFDFSEIYEPRLTAININGATVIGSGTSIDVFSPEPPSPVIFTATPTSGLAPLTVQFYSPNEDGEYSIYSWNWGFGDGSTGSGQNPSHTYTNAGTFYPGLNVYIASEEYSEAYGSGPAITVSPYYTLSWFKVAGGGGTSTGGVYTVSDTIGQQDAGGPMQGGGYSVEGGFWSLYAEQSSSLTGTAPTITSQPQSLIVTNGAPVSFNVSVSGTLPLFYQWQQNGINLTDGGTISGSSTTNLSLNTTLFNVAGNYTLIIENAYGSVTSSVANLTFILPTYYVTDLGSLGGAESIANGINNSGQVVGFSYTASGAEHAFLYSGGTMNDLGTLGGSDSFAQGINNSGQVVGYFYTSSGYSHAFLYSGGTMNDLGTLGGNYSLAYGINNSGQVVGFSYTASGAEHAFLYSGGTMNDLGTLGGSDSEALGINNSGQVVGFSYTASGAEHAFLYSGGTMNDLGTLGGNYSFAQGINNSGQVVGWSYTASGAEHAFLYSGGMMQDLGALPNDNESRANGINNSGQIVGYSSPGRPHAFLYSGGSMFDLNNLLNTNLGAYLDNANGINDSGQIIADANNNHAYLLTPSQPNLQSKVQSTAMTGGNFQFSWNVLNTYPPIGYQVQYTTNLIPPDWINLGGVLPGTNSTLNFTNSIGANPQGFYRVMLVQ